MLLKKENCLHRNCNICLWIHCMLSFLNVLYRQEFYLYSTVHVIIYYVEIKANDVAFSFIWCQSYTECLTLAHSRNGRIQNLKWAIIYKLTESVGIIFFLNHVFLHVSQSNTMTQTCRGAHIGHGVCLTSGWWAGCGDQDHLSWTKHFLVWFWPIVAPDLHRDRRPICMVCRQRLMDPEGF